jgi:hypothetical protein
MKRLKFLIIFMFLAFTLFYSYGCSGGGGGSDGNNSGLNYSGVTTSAEIDELNAEEISGGALGVGLISDGMVGISSVQSSDTNQVRNFRAIKIPEVLNNSLKSVYLPSPSLVAAQTTASENDIYGNCGGSMSYSITVDDVDGSFEGSFSFSNYCEDGTFIDGEASFDGLIDVVTSEFIEVNFSFATLTSGDLTLDGEIFIDFTVTPIEITFNVYTQDLSSDSVYWADDYFITIDEFAGFEEVEISGTFYHPDYGYVTISTPDPFTIHDGDEWPTSGTLLVIGANDTKAQIIAISNLTFVIEADLDGDDAYEWNSEVTNWEDL